MTYMYPYLSFCCGFSKSHTSLNPCELLWIENRTVCQWQYCTPAVALRTRYVFCTLLSYVIGAMLRFLIVGAGTLCEDIHSDSFTQLDEHVDPHTCKTDADWAIPAMVALLSSSFASNAFVSLSGGFEAALHPCHRVTNVKLDQVHTCQQLVAWGPQP